MPIPRKRSCAQCRLAKTRCSLDAPKCTRCRSRSLQCDYSEALPRATVGEGHANTRFWSNTPISQVEQATPLPSEFLMETDSTFPLQWAEPNFSDVLFNDDEPWIEYTHEESVPLQQPELRHQQPNQMHVYMQLEADQQTLGYLNDVSQRLLNNDTLCASWSPDRIPAQFKTLLCRKPTENLGRSLVNTHILKTFRIYPSMLAKSTFPPFIHKYCAAKDYTRLLLEDNFRLLEPLANCMAFIPMFRSRIPGSTKFIHRTLFAEAQRLHSEIQNFDRRMRLAAAQALTIYIILLSEEEESERNSAMNIVLLLALGEIATTLFYKLLICEEGQIPDWADWALDESARRTLTVLWILRTVIYTDIGVSTSGSCRTFHDIQLPASKDLWEATTNSEWVTRYQAYIKARKGSEPLKVGALFAAQQPNSDLDHDESQAEDLHGWSSTTDDFGSLLIMAIR